MTGTQSVDPGKRKRGPRRKIRDEALWKRNVRKKLRNSGLPYTSITGKTISAKVFNSTDCKCIRECHKLISMDQREKNFKNYYQLANHDFQTSYLCGQVKLISKIRSTKTAEIQKRHYTRIYCLPNEQGVDVPVCKEFFKKILQVSDGRLTRSLKEKQNGNTPSKDMRGAKEPYNKTKDERIQAVINFISQFPKYQSHYSRKKNPNRFYLAPSLNISKMFNLYRNQTENPVSMFIFRNVFKTKFNLCFHAPVSDSCKTCDSTEQIIKFETDETRLKDAKCKKELHLRKAEAARNGMNVDAELGKTPENDITVIAFDLMSTLPTPDISTGIVYYKRQLWSYCLGIHNLSTNEAHMYIWNESVASRGPQEIGSCLLNYIKNFVKTSRLIMYSDQCGGQNRNVKLAVLCNYMIEKKLSMVQQIDHKFLVSGHSYLACDRDFGVIEKHKKGYNDIYVPNDWVKIIKGARKRNPFVVIEMQKADFISTEPLEKNITNRKKTNDGHPVNWLKMQWLKYSASNHYEFSYKESNNEDVLFNTINVRKRNASTSASTLLDTLPMLYPNGRKIDVKKFANLQELLDFIPPVHHKFYNDLQFQNNGDADPNRDEDDEVMVLQCVEKALDTRGEEMERQSSVTQKRGSKAVKTAALAKKSGKQKK